jgi:dolichol kinase
MDYKKEVRRGLFHIGLCIFIVVLVQLLAFDIIVSSMLVVLGVGLILSDISRRKIKIPVINYFLNTFGRPQETKKFPGRGAFYLIAGSLLAIVLFEKNIALASILVLAFGDSLARLAGQFGKTKNPLNRKKKLEGTLAGAIAGGAAGMFFVSPYIAFTGSLAGMAAELIDFEDFQIDDNIIVPLVSGLAMHLVSMLF